MRQVISFLVACALLIGGLWLAYMQLFVSPVARGWFLMMAGLMIAIGGAWLIGDYILPMLRKKASD